MRIRNRRRAGFSLLEILVVTWLMGLLLLLGVASLLGALKVEEAAASANRDLLDRSALADAFRGDVASAVAAAEAVGAVKAGPACLILRSADGKHVVYRWEKGQLERSAPDGPKSPWRPLAAGRGVTAVEFVRGGVDGRLVTLRLTASRVAHGATSRTEYAAALGGDVR